MAPSIVSCDDPRQNGDAGSTNVTTWMKKESQTAGRQIAEKSSFGLKARLFLEQDAGQKNLLILVGGLLNTRRRRGKPARRKR
jgi:hypothetical protein